MLLNVAAHNVNVQNLKVSKRERHRSQNIHTFYNADVNVHFKFCNGIRFVTLNAM
jgi:hypothetical protein